MIGPKALIVFGPTDRKFNALMRQEVGEFCAEESGATLVEYGVALLIAISVGGFAITALTGQTQTNFQSLCTQLAVEQVGVNECDTGDN